MCWLMLSLQVGIYVIVGWCSATMTLFAGCSVLCGYIEKNTRFADLGKIMNGIYLLLPCETYPFNTNTTCTEPINLMQKWSKDIHGTCRINRGERGTDSVVVCIMTDMLEAQDQHLIITGVVYLAVKHNS